MFLHSIFRTLKEIKKSYGIYMYINIALNFLCQNNILGGFGILYNLRNTFCNVLVIKKYKTIDTNKMFTTCMLVR